MRPILWRLWRALSIVAADTISFSAIDTLVEYLFLLIILRTSYSLFSFVSFIVSSSALFDLIKEKEKVVRAPFNKRTMLSHMAPIRTEEVNTSPAIVPFIHRILVLMVKKRKALILFIKAISSKWSRRRESNPYN